MENEKNDLLIPLAIVIAGALIGVGVYFSAGYTPSANAPHEEGGTKQPTREALLKNAVLLGNPEAPVVMVEYADFQCPYCGKFFKETSPLIIDSYVKSGKVLLAYKDFAFLGPESGRAALAARCAKDQDKFWQYHDFLYSHLWDTYYSKNQNGENVGAFSDANLKKFAANLKLDTARFNECMDKDTHAAAVAESTDEARDFGVTGTPAFFINDKSITGAQPYAQFQKIIEDELKNKL
jgi:protein-disulfide isomerase